MHLLWYSVVCISGIEFVPEMYTQYKNIGGSHDDFVISDLRNHELVFNNINLNHTSEILK